MDDRSSELRQFRVPEPTDYMGGTEGLRIELENRRDDYKVGLISESQEKQDTIEFTAIVLRLAYSDNPKLSNQGFIDWYKQFASEVKNTKGEDFEFAVAYEVLRFVFEKEGWEWKEPVLTDEEKRVRDESWRKKEGEVPRGKRVDKYEIGEPPQEMRDYLAQVLADRVGVASVEELEMIYEVFSRTAGFEDSYLDKQGLKTILAAFDKGLGQWAPMSPDYAQRMTVFGKVRQSALAVGIR